MFTIHASDPKPAPETPIVKGEKESQDPAYLILSCASKEAGEITAIKVYDAQGRFVVQFPPEPPKNHPIQMVALSAGNYGVLIDTLKGSIVGQIDVAAGQKRNVNLSRWASDESKAEYTVTTSPSGQKILCNGVPLEAGKFWLTIGTHRLRIDINGFQANEQTVMVLDNSPQSVALSITMARLQFQLPHLPPQSKAPRILVNGTTVSKPDSHVIMSGDAIIQIYDQDALVGNFQIQVSAGQQILLQLDRLKSGLYDLHASEMAGSSESTNKTTRPVTPPNPKPAH